MFKIKYKHNFEAAHRLTNYEGKCKNIHGHNYAVRITISSATLDKDNMVIDFNKLKKICKNVIDKNLDHCIILDKKDKNLYKSLKSMDHKIYLIQGSPTAENLAYEIYLLLLANFKEKERYFLDSVEIYENDKSIAIWEDSLKRVKDE